MSPSEFDLRAALRAGEGEQVDADDVIAHAVMVRHARRVRLGSIAAAVVAVGAIGVGGAALVGNRSHSTTDAARKASGPGTAYDASRGEGAASQPQPGGAAASSGAAAGPSLPAAASLDAVKTPCPATPPALMLPGGGGSGQFGSTGSLFSATVGTIKVCGYSAAATQAGAPPQIVFAGAQARDLAGSLDAASVKLNPLPCPTLPPGQAPGRLVILAVSTSGTAMEPIVVTLGCNGKATNGTAVRYSWVPPQELSGFLASLEATPAPTDTAGRVSGSPAR